MTQNTGCPSAVEHIRQSVAYADGQWVGEVDDVRIRSVFQPIYSLVHSRMVGVEGLIRCADTHGQVIPPLEMLARADREESKAVHLDRLCRYLHLNNLHAHVPEAYWLFMNVSARTVIAGKNYGTYFAELLHCLDFPAHRVVIEILEDDIRDEQLLASAVEYYRELGCIIAIDDFGAGNSNFNRVWQISPDIVKLDRSLVVRAKTDGRTRRALPSLVEMLRESGCLVLMEGIETEQEAVIAVKSGVDMVQGYYFARPSLRAEPCRPVPEAMRHIQGQFIEATRHAAIHLGSRLKPYVESFQAVLDRLRVGYPFEASVAELMGLPLVSRSYMLDHEGVQHLESVSGQASSENGRFDILTRGAGADWSTRSYYRRAIQSPGQVQITTPYLSVADADICITLSIADTLNGQVRVVCCDLRWEEL